MKKIYVSNRNGVVPDLSAWFDVRFSVNDLDDVDAFVLWNDAVGENRVIAEQALLLGKPVFVIQHGFYSSKDTEYAENKSSPLGSTHLLWSPYHSELFQRDGVSPEKIILTGSTLYAHLRPRGSDGETVVFAPAHLGTDEQQNRRNAVEASQVWDTLNKVPDIRTVAKLVAGEHSAFHFSGNVVSSSLTSLNHVPAIIKLLQTCACVVTQDETTFSFLSYAMDVPVIKIENDFPPFSEASLLSSIGQLPETIRQVIENQSLKRRERYETTLKMGGDPKRVRSVQAVVDAIKASLEVKACA